MSIIFDDGPDFMPVAGFFTTDYVSTAVDFTNKNVGVGGVIKSAWGGGLVSAVNDPAVREAFVQIAHDDEAWKKYCKQLAETNYVVTCGYIVGPQLRKSIKERLGSPGQNN